MADQMNTVPRMISSAVFVRVMNTSVGHDCVVPLSRVRHGAAVPYFFFDDFFLGTFAPDLRASESPMAMACLRLVTFFPDRPDFSLPCFFSRIARSTFSPAFLPYFAIHPPAHRGVQAARLNRDQHTCCARGHPRRAVRHPLRSYAGRERSYPAC